MPEADIYASDICQPVLSRAPFDLIFSCDVIYVPGLAASRAGLQTLAGALRPGGQFVLHLPAYNWLKSHHDLAVHTRERFVLGQAKRLMHELNLECVRASYRLCPLLPLIVAKRLPSLILRSSRVESHDLSLPPAWLNRWLLRVVQWENGCIARGHAMPCGSSLVVMARSLIA